ncbi:hypothetical protein VNO80_08419 [Phaseolus coccineus]|uniref:Uncharacterized protein n=1 Tax=Phaseolus coccineus TaxID=3886 RepID=A0AAN9RG74_PHACN
MAEASSAEHPQPQPTISGLKDFVPQQCYAVQQLGRCKSNQSKIQLLNLLHQGLSLDPTKPAGKCFLLLHTSSQATQLILLLSGCRIYSFCFLYQLLLVLFGFL